MTLLVRRCFQCSAGQSKKVRSTSASFSRVATAFGYLAPYSVANRFMASRACARVSAYIDLVECGLHARLEALRELVQDVAELVEPVPLLARLRPHIPYRCPEAEPSDADSDAGQTHAPALQGTEHQLPTLDT